MAEEGRLSQFLAEELAVERIGEDTFTTRLLSHGGHAFGGETLGCATLAAVRTCEGRDLHSLYASFLRPVPPDVPIQLRVERLADGRRLARRRVQVSLEDRLLCDVIASFAAPGAGAEFQDTHIEPGTPPPETLPSDEEVARAEGWEMWGEAPVAWKWVGRPWQVNGEEHSRYRAWVRPRVPLPEDPGLHSAVVAYLSDWHSHWPVARKLRAEEFFMPRGFISLDSVLWLHRPAFWDDWWLFTSESDVAHAGRALTRRTLHARDGRLIASMAQEAFIPSSG